MDTTTFVIIGIAVFVIAAFAYVVFTRKQRQASEIEASRRCSVSLSLLLSFSMCAVVTACGGLSAEHGGQSSLIEQTFAGANRCSPKNHERPFIIEWDATDQSSFQARTSNDVVIVRYEGCDLKVLDNCSMDSVRGAFGAYKPIDWTSGQLESIDLANESDLFAKLPLGAASLGGRVRRGEKFHMEYYVSGTRSATRDRVYRSALAKVPGCEQATHFVYAYNVGAFALGSASKMKGDLNGSYFGFGAGASNSSSAQADKRGGDLGSCKSNSAKEIDGCKTPIRLTLREISDGEDPQTVATQAPETDRAANLAGRLKAETDAQKEAEQHAQNAATKFNARDGQGCVAEFDAHDKLDPRPQSLSTNPQVVDGYAMTRAACLMLSGQCEAGKQLFRKAAEAQWPEKGVLRQAAVIDQAVGKYCQGNTMSASDKRLQAVSMLRRGGEGERVDGPSCMKAYRTLKELGVLPEQRPADASEFSTGIELMGFATNCLINSGDCADLSTVCMSTLTWQWGNEQNLKKRYPNATFYSTCQQTVEECKTARKGR
jgi:hypothetical protein